MAINRPGTSNRRFLLLSRSGNVEGRAIDLAFLDEILNPNPTDDVLRWFAELEQLRSTRAKPGPARYHQAALWSDLAKGALTPHWCWRQMNLMRPMCCGRSLWRGLMSRQGCECLGCSKARFVVGSRAISACE